MCRRWPVVACLIPLLLAGTARGQAAPAGESAQSAPPHVEVQACDGLQRDEIARVLRVELGSAGVDDGALARFGVEVQCGGEWIRLTLQPRGGGDYLDRLIPAPPADDPGRERIVALAASQMVLAWLPRHRGAAAQEQGVTSPPPDAAQQSPQAGADPEPAPDGAARPAAAAADEPVAERPQAAPAAPASPLPDARWPTPVLWVRAGVRGAGLEQSATTIPGVALGVRTGLLPALELDAGIEIGHATATRSRGDVGVTAGGLGAGLSFAAARTRALSLQLGADLTLGYLRISGEPSSGSVGDTRQGVTADLALHLGPRIRFGRVTVSVLARGGYLLGGAEGEVEDGRPVAPGGPWLGAALELGLSSWGEAERAPAQRQ